MERLGFGLLIANSRIAAGMTQQELAERLHRKSKTSVIALENEDQRPSVEDINVLTASLPLSAEVLLTAMGVHLSAPLAARLERPLLERLIALRPEQRLLVHRLIDFANEGLRPG